MDQQVRADLETRGVLDPETSDTDRERAVALLLDLGATPDEIVDHRDDLGFLASKLVNGGRSTMSRRDLAARVGMSLRQVERLALAAGLPDPGPDALSVNDDDVALMQTFAATAAFFGEDTALQLARVAGGSAAKMGDAIVSAYRATLGQQSESDPSGLARVEANITLAELRPTFMHALEQLLKRHVAHWSRPLDSGAARGYDTRTVAVGFMDLVGSTALAARLSTEELSSALSEFEATSGDIIVGHGGRVVKLIGDEVMFTHGDTSAICTIASGLVAAFDTHPVLGGVRVGIAHGDVLTRDGDSFGPVVNLAARIVAVAEPGQVLVDDASAAAAAPAWTFIPAGSHTFKGFAESTSVHQLVTPAAAVEPG